MTKRFTQIDEDDWEILDNGNHLAFAHSGYNAEKIIEVLNELNGENEQLKQQREQLFVRERDTKNRWRELKEENKQLKSDLTHTKVLLNSLQDKYNGLLNLVHGFDGDVE